MSEEYFEKMYQKYGGENVYTEKWLFIANNIFDFTTYDDEMSFKWYNEMIAVIRVILNRTTFEYQKEHYETYLFMCNLPFLFPICAEYPLVKLNYLLDHNECAFLSGFQAQRISVIVFAEHCCTP